MTTNKPASYFESVTGKPVNPLWLLRGFGFAILTFLLLAMFVFKTGNRHDFCIGLATGTLIGMIAQLFAVKNIEVNNDLQSSDVDNLCITR